MIELHHLTKSYRTGKGRHYVFRDASGVFPSGKNIGIIGANGAGKSTLLRLIGRTDFPDRGEVLTSARISWPVGLSGGFQGSLSGRDNVRFVCRINGLDDAEIRERVQFVQAFAELGEYFDQPVVTYSSGMRSRLGFGLSLAFEFDYYLVDEIMSVGDVHFRDKSRELFAERASKANLIIVSHNMRELLAQCEVGVFVGWETFQVFDDIRDAIYVYNALS